MCASAAPLFRNLFERGADILNVRLDEARMIIEGAQLSDLRRSWADLSLAPLDVFAVLAAARIRAVGGSDEGQRVFDPVGGHLLRVSASIGCQLRLPQ